jgi:O-antigen ligase
MIRLTALVIFLLFIWIYAFRDWFVSLCAMILMTVLLQNDDMPRTLLGIQGLNPWNVSLLIITIAWAIQRISSKQPPWRAPPFAIAVVIAYLAVLFVAYVRLIADAGSLPAGKGDFLGLTTEMFINPMKFFWAAVLLTDGCTSRPRFKMAIATVIGVGVLYALFVLKNIPVSYLSGGPFMSVRHRIDKEIGLHANDMAKVLVLTFWGLFATYRCWPRWEYKATAVGCMLVVLLGVGLCFSRAGYIAWVGVGFLLACFRWRKLLILGPVALVVICATMPSVRGRLLMDLVGQGGEVDLNVATAGRTGHLWPPVIEQIGKSPVVGYGRLAMFRTPAYDKILETEGVVPTSPHNGYLEVMLETGLIGMVVTLAVFLGSGLLGFLLMRMRHDTLFLAAGGLGFVHATGCLITALSGAMLFPDQGMLVTMCAFGITLRAWSMRYQLMYRSRSAVPAGYTVPYYGVSPP